MKAPPIERNAVGAAPRGRRRGRPLRVLGLVLGGWIALRLVLAGLAMTGAADSALRWSQGRESMLAARPGDTGMLPARQHAGVPAPVRVTRQEVIAVSAMAADRDGFGARPSRRWPDALLAALDHSQIPFARE